MSGKGRGEGRLCGDMEGLEGGGLLGTILGHCLRQITTAPPIKRVQHFPPRTGFEVNGSPAPQALSFCSHNLIAFSECRRISTWSPFVCCWMDQSIGDFSAASNILHTFILCTSP